MMIHMRRCTTLPLVVEIRNEAGAFGGQGGQTRYADRQGTILSIVL